MRHGLLVLLAASLLVPPSGSASAPAGPTLPWELVDCTYLIAFASVDRDRVIPHLPAGFAAAGAPTTVGPLTLPSVVNVGFEVDVCAQGTGVSGLLPDMQYASFWVAVDAPPAWQVEGINQNFVNWDVLVPDAERRALMQAAGLPARDGAIALTVTPTPLGETLWEASWTLDGLGTFRAEAVAMPGPGGPFDTWFVQYTEASDGDLARWRTNYVSDDSRRGFGVLDADPGSWLGQMLPAPSVPITALMGHWSYLHGLLELPA